MAEYMVCVDGGPPPVELLPRWWSVLRGDANVCTLPATAMRLAEHLKREAPDAVVSVVVL